MGIRFECVHCGHALHLKEFLAGKRAICPHCQGTIEVPSNPASAAENGAAAGAAVPQDVAAGSDSGSFDPIAEAPQLHWYVLPPGSITKYGPAQGEMMRTWIQQGRIAGDAMVWREGWPDWRVAASVFPLLNVEAVPAAPVMPATSNKMVASATPQPRPAEQAAVEPVTVEPLVSVGPVDTQGPAVVLGIDDTSPRGETTRGGARRATTGRKERNQRTLIVGLLVALFVIVLPLLVYVLLQ